MSNQNRPVIAVILPAEDPWLPDDPRAREARLDEQLAYLENIAQRARRRARAAAHTANGAAGGGRDAGEDEDDDDESELKPRNGRFC
ncbi:MAG: hypothetical protein ACRYHA_27040 [Janthinobacterium lividum]